jgi:hypothetical protein
MKHAIETVRETFRDSFMQPECYIGADIEEELIMGGYDAEIDKIYCRLSASGFLDCTDWHGPFDTIEESAMFLIETYGEEHV